MILSRFSRAVGIFLCAFPGDILTCRLRRAVPATLLACLMLCASASAQSTIKLSGYVYDAVDGSALSGARARLTGTDLISHADEFGHFAFESVPNGRYQLRVDADGYSDYESDVITIVTDITRSLTVRLQRRPHKLPDTRVTAAPVVRPTAPMSVLDRGEIERSGAIDVGDALGSVEGIYVQKAGAAGQQTTVSIRGCDPKHVLVLVDGQRISADGGQADLSIIPLAAVEKIEVYRGGQSAEYGADAIGGVVNIVTQTGATRMQREVNTGTWVGRWKSRGLHLTARDVVPMRGLSSKIHYVYTGTEADFPYSDYIVSPQSAAGRSYSGTRQNADFSSSSINVSGVYPFSESVMVHASGQLYRAVNGLPGPVSDPDSTSRKEDRRLSGHLRLTSALSRRNDLNLSVQASRYLQRYENRDAPRPANRYETRYVNDRLQLRAADRLTVGSGLEVKSGAVLSRDVLYHDDILRPTQSMGRTIRDNAGLFMSGHASWDTENLPGVAVEASLRWDNTTTRNTPYADTVRANSRVDDQWSEKIGLAVTAGGDSLGLVVRASYGHSYRLPAMNALFWKDDVQTGGNTGLRPERSEHSEIGAEFKLTGPVSLRAGATYFHSHVRDIIVWRPGAPSGVWQPMNLDAAVITGHEDFIVVGFLADRLRLTYQNTVTVPKNRGRSAYNSDLTYRPRYVTRLEAALRSGLFHAAYSLRLVDKRYSLETNTKWYDAYRIDDVVAGFGARLGPLDYTCDVRVENLRDEAYVLIGRYPMPGRQWTIELKLSYALFTR